MWEGNEGRKRSWVCHKAARRCLRVEECQIRLQLDGEIERQDEPSWYALFARKRTS